MKKLFGELMHFGIIGVFNTLLGFVLIMVFYNVFHWSYWVSSGTSYIIGSIFSYFANKKLTFKVEAKSWLHVVKFAANAVVCYFIAYGVAKPLVKSILSGYSVTIVENIAMMVGMVLFTSFNFIGQKFFVFPKDENKKE